MANIDLCHFQLYDRWPGAVNPNLGIPTGGWDNTTDNFPTSDDTASAWSPPYPVGTKIMAYTDNSACPGYYTMMYLMYHCSSATVGLVEAADISAGTAFCFHFDGSDAQAFDAADTSTVPYYVVANCNSAVSPDISKGVPLAIPCATISAGESSAAYVSGYGDSYGWFWIGGVCPCADATLLQGTGSATTGVDLVTKAILTHQSGREFAFEFTSQICYPTGMDCTHFDDSTASFYGRFATPAYGVVCTTEI